MFTFINNYELWNWHVIFTFGIKKRSIMLFGYLLENRNL